MVLFILYADDSRVHHVSEPNSHDALADDLISVGPGSLTGGGRDCQCHFVGRLITSTLSMPLRTESPTRSRCDCQWWRSDITVLWASSCSSLIQSIVTPQELQLLLISVCRIGFPSVTTIVIDNLDNVVVGGGTASSSANVQQLHYTNTFNFHLPYWSFCRHCNCNSNLGVVRYFRRELAVSKFDPFEVLF